jgi:hypothetical protein
MVCNYASSYYTACLEIFAPLFGDYLSQLLPFGVLHIALSNKYVFYQDMKQLFVEPRLAIGFKVSKTGISHVRVFFYRYSGRGLFLNPPTVFIKNETCTLSLPQWMQHSHLSPGDKCQLLVFDISDYVCVVFYSLRSKLIDSTLSR